MNKKKYKPKNCLIVSHLVITAGLLGYANVTHAQQATQEFNQVGANRQTVIVISKGSGVLDRQIIRAQPGEEQRITAGRAPEGFSFSHWAGDTRILKDVTRRSQTIRVPRSTRPLQLMPVFSNGEAEQVVVAIQGQSPRVGFPGETITIQARKLRGQQFLRWEGRVKFVEDVEARKTTITLPDHDIRLRPLYRTSRNANANPAGDNRADRTANRTPNRPIDSTGDITIVSHAGSDTIRRQGDTLIGRVPDPEKYSSVVASIGDREVALDTDPETGQFVMRLDSEDFDRNVATVSFSAASVDGESINGEFSASVETDMSGVSRVLSRVSFGATPGLKARFASSGNPEAAVRQYIREQLNPTARNDRLVRQLEVDRLAQADYSRRGGDPLAWRLGYAMYSENQLREIMTEFWHNHFFTETRDFMTDIRVIGEFRENAFGNFRDLLQTSATSPAMMFYLNNRSNRRDNINENYARELMELHTLGVDAGYGPEDVIAVARVKTGWGSRRLLGVVEGVTPDLSEFVYDERRHDTDDKFIPFLNVTIEGRSGEEGMEEGEELLDILADHPSTRNFLCRKLTQRFVADEKPQKYVDACVDAWAESDGNMGEAVGAILTHEDYVSDLEYDRSKVRTPYEYTINLMRAFNIFPAGSEVSPDDTGNDFFNSLTEGLDAAGYRVTGSPDGNPEDAGDWIAAGSLINNMRTTVSSFGTRFRSNGSVGENEAVDIDFDFFGESATVPTAEGVADYMLSVATADSHKSDEVEIVADALRGPDGTFDPSNGSEVEADIRRAMTVIAVMPNTFIQ